VTQGFAHRGAADAEAIAQIALDQAVAGQSWKFMIALRSLSSTISRRVTGLRLTLKLSSSGWRFMGSALDVGCPCQTGI
jgi:hypothetical protein